MACMCGDLCCPSCGPAQGNSRCPICREWLSECCEHFDDDGNLKPEFIEQANEIARAEALADEQLVRDLAEDERLADEYWKNQ